MDGSAGDPGITFSKHEGASATLKSAGHGDANMKMGSPKTNGHVSNHVGENHVKTPSSSSHKHKDGHHHSSSSSKHKHSSSHSSSSSSKDKHKSSSGSSSKHESSSHHKSSSSSSSVKLNSSSSKHHSSSSSSSKDKHHSSSHSSSDKHKDKSKDHHHSSSKHKDGSSSSSKHREGGSSSSSSKHRDGEHKSKDKHSSDKHKHSSSSSKSEVKTEPGSSTKHSSSNKSDFRVEHKVKTEPWSPEKMASPKVKSEPMSPRKVMTSPKMKKEAESDDDIPLSSRKEAAKGHKRPHDDSDDDTPLSDRAEKVKKVIKKEEKIPNKRKSEKFDDEPKAKKKKVKKEEPGSGKKKKEEAVPQEKWRWWEEERKDDGTKWKFLEHKGPVFAPAYEPLPKDIKFYYDGKVMKLSQNAEEIGGFYAKMLEHDYTTKGIFNKNFFKDWRKHMTREERETITDLNKCNFKEMHAFFMQQSEERKNRTKEEKLALKKQNEAMQLEYGFCVMDGHKEKIGNFKIEPPGLFRGRGEHPKQGMLKTRTQPEDVIINCSKNSKVPEAPAGHRWKEVRHDNTVTWLCCWTENVQNSTKYVMLNPTSRLKGEKDWMKYETARKLHKCVDKIRANYYEDFKSKEMRIRQRSVALYFIDKLALRAGNEKDEDTADTVGCCSLRVEHIKLYERDGDKDYVVEFDFLGKDSIRYQNKTSVEKRVFKNLQLFTDNKSPGDDLFDRLNTAILNKHLHDLMEGLTAKVFRTYNASRTLQEQLDLLTNEDDPIPAKLLAYNRANRAVAVLCNHQRAVPKNFSKQMENLQIKIKAKKDMVKEAKKQFKAAKADYKASQTDRNKMALDKKKKAVQRLEEQLTKLEVQATDKDENKEIALGTSKLNYLDPRISVAWCKKWEVPIEKVYNKTQREKFAWAIDMADEDFHF